MRSSLLRLKIVWTCLFHFCHCISSKFKICGCKIKWYIPLVSKIMTPRKTAVITLMLTITTVYVLSFSTSQPFIDKYIHFIDINKTEIVMATIICWLLESNLKTNASRNGSKICKGMGKIELILMLLNLWKYYSHSTLSNLSKTHCRIKLILKMPTLEITFMTWNVYIYICMHSNGHSMHSVWWKIILASFTEALRTKVFDTCLRHCKIHKSNNGYSI